MQRVCPAISRNQILLLINCSRYIIGIVVKVVRNVFALTVHATLLTIGILRLDVYLHIEVLDLVYLYRVALDLVGHGPFLVVDVSVETYFVSFLKELMVLVLVVEMLLQIVIFISLSHGSRDQIALLVVVLLLSWVLHICVVELRFNQTPIWSTHCQ